MEMLKEGTDDKLVMLASGGNSLAKNTLMARYQPFVLRLVKRMKVNDPEDATQDILVKVILNLHQFENRSLFTTWLYRIAVNHVLALRKKSKRTGPLIFTDLENNLPSDSGLNAETVHLYMHGVITCLQPDQRITLILADHFQLDHYAAAEFLSITPVNFRKRLSRARKDLQHWTTNQCSLLGNGVKQCRCSKKTKHFISQGWVDPAIQKFTKERLMEVRQLIVQQYSQTADQLPSIT
jgi:RNA polymerase sigma factor (sigma-70 family)